MLKVKCHFILSLFLGSYIVMGFWLQTTSHKDIYPYSNWFLFSYVNPIGELIDLKFTDPKGQSHYIRQNVKETSGESSIQYKDVSILLHRIKKFTHSNRLPKAKPLIEDIMKGISHTGEIIVVKRFFDRLNYYNEGKLSHEEEVYRYSF